jgi:hypothetical protein
MYKIIIYFVGGTIFETTMKDEKDVEHFKNVIESEEIKNDNYFIRTSTDEGFNVANINCYKIIKL